MTTMESYSVPLKLSDGHDDEERTVMHHHLDLVGEESKHQHQGQDDAFSRYSNDILRMKSLLLLSTDVDQEDDEDDDDDDDDLDALATINQALSSLGLSTLTHLNRDNKRRRGNDSRRIQQGTNVRKTRLSWELHPDLLLHDFTLELEALCNGTHRIIDDEEEASEKKPQRSQVQEAPREEREEKE
jgi:hypothetical protein